MVELAQVSRASFYRFDKEAEALPDPDIDLRDTIQRLALEMAELWMAANHG
jgi:hypothetical protein